MSKLAIAAVVAATLSAPHPLTITCDWEESFDYDFLATELRRPPLKINAVGTSSQNNIRHFYYYIRRNN